jgi:hypothetical protein
MRGTLHYFPRAFYPSFRGAAEGREPGIHPDAASLSLDSGFACSRSRPGMTE